MRIKMKTYTLKNGRKVYIKPTIRTPWKGGSKGLPYSTKPYTIRYVEDDSLAIDGTFCCVATAKESIEFYNKD